MRPSPITPDGAHGRQHGEALPQLAVEAGPADLLDHDGVGRPQDLGPLGGDLADDAHGQARAREGLAPDDLVGQAELLADGAHLVLEQQAQRLDQVEGQVLGQPAHVVVRLDVGRRRRVPDSMTSGYSVPWTRKPAGPSPGVAVDRSAARSRATSSKMRMNSSPMILRLRLGVGHPGQRRRRSGRPPSRGPGRRGTGAGRSPRPARPRRPA